MPTGRRNLVTITEKLYWPDPMATSFSSAGARLSSFDGKPSLTLSRTLFYPEGGGQLGDTGTLALESQLIRVQDTQIDPNGIIHHLLVEALAEGVEGRLGMAVVRGSIDEARRRDNMAQHTAQHALSRALLDEARAETVSARLGASTCTIDVNRPGLAERDLLRAEDLVNALIQSDVVVESKMPTPDELAKMDLRKTPNAEKSAAGVRVISIDGFDLTPCGGTHVTRTGQIGQVRVVATEKYKGMLRITFHAGKRALEDARTRHAALASVAADLTCGPLDVPTAVQKLRADLKTARDRGETARVELAGLLALSLREALPETPGPHVIAVMRPGDDLAFLRALANKLTDDPRVVALCASEDGDLSLVVQRGKEAKLDCGNFLMTQARACNGRGGGRPERAEGRFPKGTDLAALESAAKSALASLS